METQCNRFLFYNNEISFCFSWRDDSRTNSAEEQIPSLCIIIFNKDEGIFWTFFSYLFNLLQPFFVGCKFCHKCLMLQPFAMQVPCLIIRHILGCKHLFIDPEWELKQNTQVFVKTIVAWNNARYQNASRSRIKRCLYRRVAWDLETAFTQGSVKDPPL